MTDSARDEPGDTLADVEEWGARVRAGLFVAQGTLETERERIVAEANALGTAVLGEDLGGSSVALVRRRVERPPRRDFAHVVGAVQVGADEDAHAAQASPPVARRARRAEERHLVEPSAEPAQGAHDGPGADLGMAGALAQHHSERSPVVVGDEVRALRCARVAPAEELDVVPPDLVEVAGQPDPVARGVGIRHGGACLGPAQGSHGAPRPFKLYMEPSCTRIQLFAPARSWVARAPGRQSPVRRVLPAE